MDAHRYSAIGHNQVRQSGLIIYTNRCNNQPDRKDRHGCMIEDNLELTLYPLQAAIA